ncbi:hypothetical protein SNOG_10137 [Parastagonospora nodorum SN15]|uniref:Uncharacterized protein n=1 Tax=Phaeosphaeria nodorum (strain SN15 / ATCC MYA-4574 / FGSC 10173) TaxID=321614 RepID=Q0UDM7_PHANO|nr:hypothetical protein SNOG_10137 [Parastagonospora nodorum SN15]EAT82472.2 hypothetical protein SNOG_10137 [Parastagonospora nodorum SN15]
MSRKHYVPDQLRIELAHALGFPEYLVTAASDPEPYLNYIANRNLGRGTLEGFLELVIQVVEYLNQGNDDSISAPSIQGLLDDLATSPSQYFSDTQARTRSRRDDVEDTVMYIIGIWTMLLSSFVHLPVAGGARKITLAYTIRAQEKGSTLGNSPYEGGVSSLVTGSATRLNAYTLRVFGAVDIVWTHNLSRHMLLCKRNGQYVLEVFALPCALSATTLTSSAVGISAEYAQEITESYSMLFNAWPDTPRHATISSAFVARRFCWCWSCSAHRYRHQLISTYQKLSDKRTPGAKRSKNAHASEFDPLLVELMKNEPSDWTPDLFPSLWPRIMILEEHLQSAKPWNIWILFRDRRDTLQFWTFFFATVVVMLTFVQVILGVAQVVGSFA